MTNTSTLIVLPERVDISVVDSLYQRLQTALESGDPIEIDAESVDRLDAAGVQLLMAFALRSKKQSIQIHWKSPSDAFLKSVRLLGVEQHMLLH